MSEKGFKVMGWGCNTARSSGGVSCEGKSLKITTNTSSMTDKRKNHEALLIENFVVAIYASLFFFVMRHWFVAHQAKAKIMIMFRAMPSLKKADSFLSRFPVWGLSSFALVLDSDKLFTAIGDGSGVAERVLTGADSRQVSAIKTDKIQLLLKSLRIILSIKKPGISVITGKLSAARLIGTFHPRKYSTGVSRIYKQGVYPVAYWLAQVSTAVLFYTTIMLVDTIRGQ